MELCCSSSSFAALLVTVKNDFLNTQNLQYEFLELFEGYVTKYETRDDFLNFGNILHCKLWVPAKKQGAGRTNCHKINFVFQANLNSQKPPPTMLTKIERHL